MGMPDFTTRPQKITFAEMRASSCAGCWSIAQISGAALDCDQWRPKIAANKLGGGLQLHWVGVIFQNEVVQKSPRYRHDKQSADRRILDNSWYSHPSHACTPFWD
jgi:hypothetical protein